MEGGFLNIIDEIRDCIFKAIFKAEEKDVNFIENILNPLKEKNEEDYEKIVNIIVGDYFKILSCEEFSNGLDEEPQEHLDLINDCKDNDDIQFLFMDNIFFAESAILGFQDYCLIEQPIKISMYNFINNNYRKKLFQINKYSIYEDIFAILNNYKLEKYDKEKIIGIFEYIYDFYDTGEELEKIADFVESLCFLDNESYECFIYDLIEDSYLINKWKDKANSFIKENGKDILPELQKSFDFEEYIDYELINEVENNEDFDSLVYFSKNTKKLELYLFDFEEYNLMYSDIEKANIKNVVENKESQKILKKIRKNIDNDK